MKCRKHPPDHTSSIGVCASCLREHLFTILATQQQQQQQSQKQDSRKSENKQPIPFQFPQSVSPYISRQNTHRFHHTPHVVGPTNNSKRGWKLASIFTGLFGGSKQRKKPDSSDPIRNRGMSPDHYYDDELLKRTPKRTPLRSSNNNKGSSKNLSVFCLSPLVRPGPNRRQAVESHGLYTLPSLCKNRSRKLADFGRCSYNSYH